MNSDSDLTAELARLRKATISDLAIRPDRYPELVKTVSLIVDRPLPRDYTMRGIFVHDAFELIIQSLPDEQHFSGAVSALFGFETHKSFDLNRRRELSSAAWDGKHRGADAFYREVEKVLDHQLILTLTQLLDERPMNRDGGDFIYEKSLEAWEYDLELAGNSVARQAFADVDRLLAPHLSSASRREYSNGPSTATLLARSFELTGDAQRDRGDLDGANGARRRYRDARELNLQLGRLARANSNELMIAVCQEMTGHLTAARRSYLRLSQSTDESVFDFDRERARLWIGTVLTKQDDGESALVPILQSISHFAEVGDNRMQGNAYQKLALAQLKSDHPNLAQSAIEFAEEYSDASTPLARVRLMAARAHVARKCGARPFSDSLFEEARTLAQANNLDHQVLSIETLCRKLDIEERK